MMLVILVCTPAGTRRGVVDNATGLGYPDASTGEFTSVGIRESLRDTLYENSINHCIP